MSNAATLANDQLNTEAVMEATGATHRQLEYWVKCGYLYPLNAGKGSGFPLAWPADEVVVAGRMVELLALGFIPVAAANLARGSGQLLNTARYLLDMAVQS